MERFLNVPCQCLVTELDTMNNENEISFDGGFSMNPHTNHARVNFNGRTLVLSKGTTVQDLREKPMDQIIETDAGRA